MIPRQFCEVPFIWKYNGNSINMNIHSGFLGTHYNEEDQCLETVLFWSLAMIDKLEIEEKK